MDTTAQSPQNRPPKRPQKRTRMLCDNCTFKALAQKAPGSLLSNLWIWHTRICPGWKRYVTALHSHGEPAPEAGSKRGLWHN